MAVEQFCLKWNNFQTTIMNAFESLLSSEDLADVTLTCEGVRIKAHKLILSACSPYFRTIFKDNPCSHPIVILKDVLHQDLIAVLNFMYQGEALITQDKLNSFLQTAEALQVTGLVGNMNLRNVPTTLGNINVTKNMPKVLKINTTDKLTKSRKPETVSSEPKDIQENDGIATECVKVEISDDYQSDYNCNDRIDVYDTSSLKSQSILEAALEVKEVPSILERSLMSSASNKSPVTYPIEIPIIQESPPYFPEALMIKQMDDTFDKRPIKHKLDISSHPIEVPELLQPKQVKVDDEIKIQGLPSDISVLRAAPDIQQAHHSSQCGSCPHCGKIYSNQSALKYHVRLVHSDLTNMYCCHLCPESFDYREGYKKHMVEAHSVRN